MTTLIATPLSADVSELLPVANIADLRLLAAPSNQAQITVQGGTTAGDGNGGEFWYDATSSTADDGVDYVKPSAVTGAGRWRRIRNVALVELGSQAAHTVVGNSTGASATPTATQVTNAMVDPAAALALSKLASQSANTVVANNTTGAAVPTAVAVDDLTVLADDSSTRRSLGAHLGGLRVQSIAALKALDSTTYSDGDAVTVLGYYAAGDGGGGRFYWDSTNATTDNGGTFIKPTAVSGNGRWVRDYSGDIWANWFGIATSQSSATNLAALQAALNFTEQTGRVGGQVRLQKGAYALSGNLRLGGWTTLKGEGPFSTSLYWDATFTTDHCLTIGPDESGQFGYSNSYGFGMILEDLDLNANNADRPGKAVVYTVGAHQPSGLRRVVVRNFRNYGVWHDLGTGGPAEFILSEVELDGGATAPAAGSTVGLYCSGAGAVVKADKLIVQGVSTNVMAQGVLMSKDHLALDGGHFEQCTIGISLAQNETTARNNTIANITGHSSVANLVDVASTNNAPYTLINVNNTTTSAVSTNVLRDNKQGITIGGTNGKAVSHFNSGVGDAYKWGFGIAAPEETVHIHGGRVQSYTGGGGSTPRVSEFASGVASSTAGQVKLMEFSIPASPFFAILEVISGGSRAPSSGVGTNQITKTWFSITRNGSGSDVVLDEYATTGFESASTTGGGATNKSAIALSISRSGAEANTAAQAVQITGVVQSAAGTTATVITHVKALSHSTLTRTA